MAPSKEKVRGGAAATLATQVLAARMRRKISQGQFGRELGVSQQTVSDWEKGRRLRPIQIALRLLRLLGRCFAPSFRAGRASKAGTCRPRNFILKFSHRGFAVALLLLIVRSA